MRPGRIVAAAGCHFWSCLKKPSFSSSFRKRVLTKSEGEMMHSRPPPCAGPNYRLNFGALARLQDIKLSARKRSRSLVFLRAYLSAFRIRD
jgi:hypothetical protein